MSDIGLSKNDQLHNSDSKYITYLSTGTSRESNFASKELKRKIIDVKLYCLLQKIYLKNIRN